MKKLMITVMSAVLAFSSFAACGIEPTVKKSNGAVAWAYNWRFVGRTTAGQMLSTPDVVAEAAGACGLGGKTIKGINECVRVPYALDIQGYTYMCDPVCHSCVAGDMTEYSSFLGDNWASKEFAMFKPTYGWVDSENMTLETTVAWPIGMRGEYFEVLGNAVFPVYIAKDTVENYALTFAGLGNYGVYGSMKLPGTINGTFAGSLDRPYYVSTKSCAVSHPWNCCRTGLLEEVESIAYGNWAAKFNASAATNYIKGQTVNMPAWWKTLKKNCCEL